MNAIGKDLYRILVCGGRHFTAYHLLTRVLDNLRKKYKMTAMEIVSGHCQGADMLGEKYAEEHGFPVKVFPADWKKYGRAAGPIRNKQMIEYIRSFENRLVVAFTSANTVGTRNTIMLAKKAGIPVVEIPYIPSDDNEALTEKLRSINSVYFIEHIEHMNENS